MKQLPLSRSLSAKYLSIFVKKVENEIEKLEHGDIIEKIPENKPTEWISPVVIVPKQKNNIRLCVDMCVANTAIKQTRHAIPTLGSVSVELNGASFLSKLDLCQAYHQLELSPESRNITGCFKIF